MITTFLTLMLVFNTSGPRDKWGYINILGIEGGYNKFRLSVMEIAYGSLARGYGIGAGLFETDFLGYVFFPITLYIAKPLGRDSGPIKGQFGGPVLFPFGYQYPGIAYLFIRGGFFGISRGRWCLSESIGFGVGKIFGGAFTLGMELGYDVRFIPSNVSSQENFFGAMFFSFSTWNRVPKE